MAAAADFYRELVAWGYSVTAEGDRLLVAPRDRITDQLRQRIREAKPDLLQLLSQPPATPPQRPLVYRVKVAMDEGQAPKWLTLLGCTDLANAQRTADNQFGADRVLEVKLQ